MRRLGFTLGLGLGLARAAAACGDNTGAQVKDDAAVTPDADGPPGQLAPCLDRPTDVPRPTTELPCDLLPPGFNQP
jgi:hypothetical protein